MIAIAVAVLAATTAQAMAVPVAQLAPGKLAFADAVGGGASAPKTVKLTNIGDEALVVPSVTIDQPGVNPPGTFAIFSNNCTGASLTNGQSCTVAVTYAASGPAPRAARLKIGDTEDVGLTGNALTASAPNLEFSAQRGTVSAMKVLTVTNNGDAALPLDEIRVSGASEDRFVIDLTIANACVGSVASKATCTIGVRFLPDSDGLVDAVLRVRSHDIPNGSALVLDVPVSGDGTPGPAAEVSPRQLSFTTPVGTTSKVQEVRLTNVGSAPLNSIGVSLIGPDFAIAANTCGSTLAPAERCSVNVTFTAPAATGGFAATLRFTGNDPANPTLDVSLSGTGTVETPGAAKPGGSTNAPKPPTADADKDGVRDTNDKCPTVAGRASGCPTRLKADIRARWRVKAGRSKLLSLVVAAPIGSRIELRCSGKRKSTCGFAKRTVARTTKQRTGLTRHFKGARVLPAGVSVILRVTRTRYIGAYKRIATRTGRKQPLVTTRCLDSKSAKVIRCT